MATSELGHGSSREPEDKGERRQHDKRYPHVPAALMGLPMSPVRPKEHECGRPGDVERGQCARCEEHCSPPDISAPHRVQDFILTEEACERRDPRECGSTDEPRRRGHRHLLEKTSHEPELL